MGLMQLRKWKEYPCDCAFRLYYTKVSLFSSHSQLSGTAPNRSEPKQPNLMYLSGFAVLVLSILKTHASKVSVQSASGDFTDYSSPGCHDYVPVPQWYMVDWTGNEISLWSQYGCTGNLIARFQLGTDGLLDSVVSELGSIEIK